MLKPFDITLEHKLETLSGQPPKCRHRSLQLCPIAANALATVFVGFGINAIVRPEHALGFFEWMGPINTADVETVNSLTAVYGVRDIFMGVALYSAAIWGTKKSLGRILIAASGVAFADGYICYTHGQGQGSHWGYAPLLTVAGALLNGLFD